MDLDNDSVTAWDVSESDIISGIIAKKAVINTVGALSAGDLSVSITKRSGTTGEVTCNVTVRGKATDDGVSALSSKEFPNITFSGFKKSGAMNPGTAAGEKSAYSLKLKNSSTPLNVVNTI